MAAVNHTAGRCLCGHYHPTNQPTNTTNIVGREWVDIYSWVTSSLNNVTWDFWVHQGQPDITGKVA